MKFLVFSLQNKYNLNIESQFGTTGFHKRKKAYKIIIIIPKTDKGVP